MKGGSGGKDGAVWSTYFIQEDFRRIPGGFHEDFKIKAVARGAKASGGRGVSEWQRFYII